jgi:hypothetical protein
MTPGCRQLREVDAKPTVCEHVDEPYAAVQEQLDLLPYLSKWATADHVITW